MSSNNAATVQGAGPLGTEGDPIAVVPFAGAVFNENPAIATASDPSYTEAERVPLSTDLEGGTRIRPPRKMVFGTLAAVLDTVEIDVQGMGSVRLTVKAPGNAFVAVVTFQGKTLGEPAFLPMVGVLNVNGIDEYAASGAALNANGYISATIPVQGCGTFLVRCDQIQPGDTLQVWVESSLTSFTRDVMRVSASGGGNYGGDLPCVAVYGESLTGEGTYRAINSRAGDYDTTYPQYNKLLCYSAGGVHSGTWLEMLRTPKVFRSAQVTTAGNTPVWTPGGGIRFRLLRYSIEITGNASLAAAGVLTISLNDGGADLNLSHDVYLPVAPPAAPLGQVWSSPWYDLGNGCLSGLFSNPLNVNLSAALATGNVRINVCGTEEAF